MPIYEYVCTTCGNEFEVMQKFSDPELKRHDCSPRSKVHRKLSLPSFHLSGGGWSSQGYGSGSTSNGKNGSNGTTDSGAASASAGTETKSESKSEVKAAAHGCAAGACACG